MNFINFLSNLFSKKQETSLEVRFYTDAAAHGSHGLIRVSNVRKGLVERDVNFVFVGLKSPPNLTPELINHLWTEAKAQGYLPHALVGCLQENEAREEHEGKNPTDLSVKARRALSSGEVEHLSPRLQSIVMMAAMGVDAITGVNIDRIPRAYKLDTVREVSAKAPVEKSMQERVYEGEQIAQRALAESHGTVEPTTGLFTTKRFDPSNLESLDVPSFLRRGDQADQSGTTARNRLASVVTQDRADSLQ